MTAAPLLSVVTPAFDEAPSLPLLHARLAAALAELDDLEGSRPAWEWIVVDDGSRDGTGETLARLTASDPRVRGLRLDRNRGSHPAILRGLADARGAAVLVLAADLQDPPELTPQLLALWRQGARIVWAVRGRREGDGRLTVALANLYHGLLRRFGGAPGLPAGGAGFCLLDRSVVDALCRRTPPPVDVFAAAGRLPVPAAAVSYDRAPRRHGHSRWSLGRKLHFAIRSLLAS
jgi:dolichol-phosphate mannosyltransferase